MARWCRSCSSSTRSRASWWSTCPTGSSTSDDASTMRDEAGVRPMRIAVFTIFPEYLRGPLALSLVGRAGVAGLLDLRVHDPRAFTTDVHHAVDDAPFGGGAGMVMMPEPIFAAVDAVQPARPLLLLS